MSWTLTETMYVECLANTWCLGEDAGSGHGTFFFYLYIKTHKLIKQQTKNPWSTFAMKLDDQIFYKLQILARKDKPSQRQDQGAWAQHLCRRKQRGQRGAPVICLGIATTQEGFTHPGAWRVQRGLMVGEGRLDAPLPEALFQDRAPLSGKHPALRRHRRNVIRIELNRPKEAKGRKAPGKSGRGGQNQKSWKTTDKGTPWS